MISINTSKCSSCKSCIHICHTGCISLKNDLPVLNHELCSTCTQCVAVCPEQAIMWKGYGGKEIVRELLPSSEQLKEFFKQRRSVRKFLETPIEKETLEKIALISKYAPTNNYSIDVIIVDNKDLIEQLEAEAITYIKKAYNRFYHSPFIFKLMKKLTPAFNDIDKAKIERTLQRGSIFQKARALIVLTADKRIVHTELSAQYGLYNMSLYAQSLGIGSCISGAGKSILSKSKSVKRLLHISADKHIIGILFLGYSKYRFPNKVDHLVPSIQWNNE